MYNSYEKIFIAQIYKDAVQCMIYQNLKMKKISNSIHHLIKNVQVAVKNVDLKEQKHTLRNGDVDINIKNI